MHIYLYKEYITHNRNAIIGEITELQSSEETQIVVLPLVITVPQGGQIAIILWNWNHWRWETKWNWNHWRWETKGETQLYENAQGNLSVKDSSAETS